MELIFLMRHSSWIVIVAFTLAVTSLEVAASAPPNVVVILADDLGYGDVQAFHPSNKIATPRLDELAASGMMLTNMHAPASVCTPSRYALMTGRYCWRSRLKRGVLGGLSPALIEEDRPTLASCLKEAGYRTACVGKWHLGMDWVKRRGRDVLHNGVEARAQVFNVEYGEPIARGPLSVGFDQFFGIAASLDMVPYTYISNDRVTELPTEDRDFFMVEGREDLGRARKGPAAPSFRVEDVLERFTREAVGYLRERGKEKDRPFFLYVPLASPHTPIALLEKDRGRSGLGPYADFVMATDDAVGEIIGELDRQGLGENTIVFFSSDNGCSLFADFQALAAKGHFPNGPFRGAKFDIFEGGSRMPTIVRWPARVAKGSRSDRLLSFVDLLPTLVEAAGGTLARGAGEDSVSFLRTLLGEEELPRAPIVVQSANGSFAILDGEWKWCACSDSGGRSDPKPNSKEARELPPSQLFHLTSDPKETKNLVEAEPGRAKDLADKLARLLGNDVSLDLRTQ